MTDLHSKVLDFAQGMVEKLEVRQMRYPDGWESKTDIDLLRRLQSEINELFDVILPDRGDRDLAKVREECIDVSNICMMIADPERKNNDH